jgi:DNA-binding CsgD family transcriptional regulator/transposase-like protein
LQKLITIFEHKIYNHRFGELLQIIFDTTDGGTEGVSNKIKLLRRRYHLPRRVNVSFGCKSKGSIAVEAFWAMHVEAMTWSGMAAKHYAAVHNISEISLRRWRDLLESSALEVDRRTNLHSSASAKISSGLSSAAKEGGAKTLTNAPKGDPPCNRCAKRRSFTDEEKLAIVLEAERADASVAAICRRHGIVTSMAFRWRVQFGFGAKERGKLRAVKLVKGRAGTVSAPVFLHDLLQPPNEMTPLDLTDGRRALARGDSRPDAVGRTPQKGTTPSSVEESLTRAKSVRHVQAESQECEMRFELLTQREREVLVLLVEGLPTKLIAYRLGISTRTTEHYRASVMLKMQARTISHLMRMTLSLRYFSSADYGTNG